MRDIIFDFDGTIIDSHVCIYEIYRRLFAELKLPYPTDEELRKFIGPPVEYAVKKFLPESECKAACERFRAMYKDMDLGKTNTLFDGVEDMLKFLFEHEKRLFIATTKNEENAKKIAKILGIEKYFSAIYGSRFEIGRLTKKQVIDDLCENEGIDKKSTVLVGDTHFDAEGAKQAGVDVVIVRYGFGDPEELKKYPIKGYYDTPSDVAKALGK